MHSPSLYCVEHFNVKNNIASNNVMYRRVFILLGLISKNRIKKRKGREHFKDLEMDNIAITLPNGVTNYSSISYYFTMPLSTLSI